MLQRSAVRTLQKCSDLMKDGDREKVKGLLGRDFNRLIPGIPFWAWQYLSTPFQMVMTDADFEEAEVFITDGIRQSLALAQRLGPGGELCMYCINTDMGVDSETADMQLIDMVDGATWEPIPVSSNHIEDAIQMWNVENEVRAVPVQSMWPPWSLTPQWGARRDNIKSPERYAYAAWQKALTGDPDGMFYVAMCYEVGCGMIRSARGAEDWYRKAAAKGYPGAKEAAERCARGGPWRPEPVAGEGSGANSSKPFWMHHG